jgi:hypothetical protein
VLKLPLLMCWWLSRRWREKTERIAVCVAAVASNRPSSNASRLQVPPPQTSPWLRFESPCYPLFVFFPRKSQLAASSSLFFTSPPNCSSSVSFLQLIATLTLSHMFFSPIGGTRRVASYSLSVPFLDPVLQTHRPPSLAGHEPL